MKNIVFLPFINDDNGKNWRTTIENSFLSGEGASLTAEINEIRKNKKSYANDKDYYQYLHEKKLLRQKLWIKNLLRETKVMFERKITILPKEYTYPENATIVCALPEFFWYDINDNNKHPEIENYHKPLYLETARDILTENNELMQLTKDYSNLIFFAGTAMWKKIDPDNHEDEDVFNSLIVYAGGEYKESITKHNVSLIDGFYTYNQNMDKFVLGKNKIGRSSFSAPPITEFNGLKFTYDICLDFMHRGNPGDKTEQPHPLSTKLCNNEGINDVDVNVLIAAGMPVEQDYINKEIKSDILLRCDGLSLPYGETFVKAQSATDITVISVDVKL